MEPKNYVSFADSAATHTVSQSLRRISGLRGQHRAFLTTRPSVNRPSDAVGCRRMPSQKMQLFMRQTCSHSATCYL